MMLEYPFNGRNPTFYSTLYAIKPHILVLNKSDLADLSRINDIRQGLLQENIHHVLFASCKGGSKSGINKIIPLVTELMKDTDFYNRGNTSSFTLMVIGIPNVGKSSLINRLRNLHLKRKSATSVGAEPGVTRSVLEKIKISDEPLIYLYDTPGVLQPCIKNVEVGLRLALCSELPSFKFM
ncbi:mitochondrial GTPase 1-like [Stegodyphus dumicola]|uniref:mitochondrial GTPase 1-like n=1 Tax=Stegodyphus dumicola TaxID=202533 RepID=UPI0015A96410|nr:mitochondrial GTPase 1-like [Stegodyphus dumicola]